MYIMRCVFIARRISDVTSGATTLPPRLTAFSRSCLARSSSMLKALAARFFRSNGTSSIARASLMVTSRAPTRVCMMRAIAD